MFCHSGLDPESSYLNMFWIPAFAGMTIFGLYTKPSFIRFFEKQSRIDYFYFTFKINIAKAITFFCKVNTQSLPALNNDINRRFHQSPRGRGQNRGNITGAASESLIFDAALIGSYFHFMTVKHFGKISVGSPGREMFVMADLPSCSDNGTSLHGIYKCNGVWHAGIDAVQNTFPAIEHNCLGYLQR